MAHPSAFLRVHTEIGRRLTQGVYPPGHRIEAEPLADELGTSPSPVRQSLYWRCGEGLLTHHALGGFTVPVLTEFGLRHLYAWQSELWRMGYACFKLADAGSPLFLEIERLGSQPVLCLDHILGTIVFRHPNREVHRAWRLATQRLAPSQFQRHDGPDPLTAWCAAFFTALSSSNVGDLEACASEYFQRSLEIVPQIAQACQPTHG